MDERWIKKQWFRSDLGDLRLNKRAIGIATASLKHPDKSLPQRLQKWPDLKGAYRFLSSEKISHKQLQVSHYQNVIEEASKKRDTILFIQDGSELLFNSHRFTYGLGPTADAHGNGLMFHTCLAIRPNHEGNAEVLGLANQEAWVRSEQQPKRKEVESAVWLETLNQIGSPPKNCRWITIGDRGSDIFDFMHGAQKQGWNFVVRAKHNRHIEINGKKQRLHSWIRALTAKASVPIYLRGRGKEFSGEITLQLSWGTASVPPPKTATHEGIQEWSFIRVHAEGRKSLEWILVTNIPINSQEDAIEFVRYYRHRWMIEEYHKALKTGCKIETNQLKHGDRILRLLGILGIVATRLLALREFSRLHSDHPAEQCVPQDMYRLICKQFNLSKITVRQFWRSVAQLGGFIGRKGDGEPGWQTIWEGFSRVKDMLLGYKILKDIL